MSEFLKVLLSLSVSGGLLLLLILALKPFYKNRCSRRWQYYIWMAAVLRFLLPFAPGFTVVGSLFEQLDAAAVTDEISFEEDAPVSVNTGSDRCQERTASDMRWLCLFFIWSVPAMVLLVRRITCYQAFTRYVKAGNTKVAELKTLNLLSDWEEKLSVRPGVELSCNLFVTSPIMIGFFCPEIILPARELEEKELSYIFAHELVHYRQKDMFIKWLVQIVVCVHWFNPSAYVLEQKVNQCCELSCDETVISMLGAKERRAYGDMLISFLKSDNSCKSSFASVTLTEGAKQIKERLGAIMNFKKKNRKAVVFTGALTLLFALCAVFIGVYTADPSRADAHAGSHDIGHLQTNLARLEQSISYRNGKVQFTIPKGHDSWNIRIYGRTAINESSGMSVHYLTDESESGSWKSGETYTIDVSGGGYTELYFDADNGRGMISVDLTELLPDNLKSANQNEER